MNSTVKWLLARFTPPFARRAVQRLAFFFHAIEDPANALEFPSQELSFRTLRTMGWRPRSCIDVGAFHGDWARMFLEVFPASRVLMIEAMDRKRPAMEESVAAGGGRLEYEIALLGSDSGREVEFTEMETGSSVFSETSHYPREVVKKRLTTLDDLLSDHPAFAQPQCLKLDTQGYELEILKGASRTLALVDVVLLEVSLLRINAGCPLFADVVTFVSQAGFDVYDFCSQIRRRDGVLWQTDLLFVRRGGSIHVDARLTPDNWP